MYFSDVKKNICTGFLYLLLSTSLGYTMEIAGENDNNLNNIFDPLLSEKKLNDELSILSQEFHQKNPSENEIQYLAGVNGVYWIKTPPVYGQGFTFKCLRDPVLIKEEI